MSWNGRRNSGFCWPWKTLEESKSIWSFKELPRENKDLIWTTEFFIYCLTSCFEKGTVFLWSTWWSLVHLYSIFPNLNSIKPPLDIHTNAVSYLLLAEVTGPPCLFWPFLKLKIWKASFWALFPNFHMNETKNQRDGIPATYLSVIIRCHQETFPKQKLASC